MSRMKDQFFTPAELAASAVKSVQLRKVKLVADFAAGHGDLLVAARSRWPSCFTFGNDFDPTCSSKLARDGRIDAYSNCDFLNGRSTGGSRQLRKLIGKCDVVLLNPPFSGRGGKTVTVQIETDSINCSLAMAFVFKAIPYLRDGGELVAILPASCLTSEKDFAVRDIIKCMTESFEIARFSNTAFEGCSASTVIVRFRRRKHFQRPKVEPSFKSTSSGDKVLKVKLVRGCVPVYRAENGFAGKKFPFIHSTDIVSSEVSQYKRSVKIETRCMQGPAVLIARVGSPATKKCAIYDCEQTIVISDCVIALQCNSIGVANKVRKRILARWDSFAKLYSGTCAPYITMNALKAFFDKNAIQVVES